MGALEVKQLDEIEEKGVAHGSVARELVRAYREKARPNWTTVIKLELPLPEPRLLSQPSGHWRKKRERVYEMRERATAEAIRKSFPLRTPYESAILDIFFWFPDNRRRDVLNYVQAIKPYIDGIVSAGWIVDDAWHFMSVGNIEAGIDSDSPRAELRLSVPLE